MFSVRKRGFPPFPVHIRIHSILSQCLVSHSSQSSSSSSNENTSDNDCEDDENDSTAASISAHRIDAHCNEGSTAKGSAKGWRKVRAVMVYYNTLRKIRRDDQDCSIFFQILPMWIIDVFVHFIVAVCYTNRWYSASWIYARSIDVVRFCGILMFVFRVCSFFMFPFYDSTDIGLRSGFKVCGRWICSAIVEQIIYEWSLPVL